MICNLLGSFQFFNATIHFPDFLFLTFSAIFRTLTQIKIFQEYLHQDIDKREWCEERTKKGGAAGETNENS